MLSDLTEKASTKLHEPVHDIESFHRWKTEMFTLINMIGELKFQYSPPVRHLNLSLDPDDWPSARYLAHQMLDTSLDYIQFIRTRPVWRSVPNDVWSMLKDEQLPKQGQPLSDVCHGVVNYIMPYPRGNIHPRFWGWVAGEGTLGGVLGAMISATLNINVVTGNHSATVVELTVIHWMRQLFGFPKERLGGLLVSGTSMATVISMATARQQVIAKVKEEGLFNGPRLVAYASEETNICVAKALELLGLGSNALHLIPIDDNFQIKISELKKAIRDDRNKGLVPFCIVGNAGKCHNEFNVPRYHIETLKAL